MDNKTPDFNGKDIYCEDNLENHKNKVQEHIIENFVTKQKKDELYAINHPAYIVKNITKGNDPVSVDVGGCVISWNEKFEQCTNFMPSDIDYKYCNDLFRGIQQVRKTDPEGNMKNTWYEVCSEKCPIRIRKEEKKEPISKENFWINCKDKRGGDIKKKTDVYIFPFSK